MSYVGRKNREKIIPVRRFNDFLGISDSDLETLSVVVSNEHYDKYINNDFSEIISVHIVLNKSKSINTNTMTSYVLDNGENYYSIAKFDMNISSSNNSPNDDYMVLDNNEVLSTISKSVRIMDFLLNYQNLWGVSFENVKSYNLNFLSEVSPIIEKDYLTIDIAPKNIRENSYRYHAISKIYNKFTHVLNSKNIANMETMKNDYAHIFISFYCLNIINGFSLNFIDDKNCYSTIEPKDSFLMTVNMFKNDFTSKVIDHNVFTSWLFHHSTANQKLFNEINKYVGKIESKENLYYVNKKELRPEGVNKYLENVHYFTSTYVDYVKNTNVEDDYWHSDLYDYIKRINEKTTEDKLQYLLFEKWMELNINSYSSFLRKELKTQNNEITKEIVDFLFSKDIIDYFHYNQKNNKINPYLVNDLKETGIDIYNNDILSIKNRVSLQTVFYLPLIIKKANIKFNLGIKDHIIHDFYNHYVNYIYTDLDISASWNVGAELEEKINTIFIHIVKYLNNENIEKFITIFPELSNLLIEQTHNTSDIWYDDKYRVNLQQISSTINTVLDGPSEFYNLIMNKEITLKHYIDIMG